MPIRVNCSGCGMHLQAPDAAAGRSAKCSSCGSRVEIPFRVEPPPFVAEPTPFAGMGHSREASEHRDVHQKYCQECGERIRALAEICPKCGVRQFVPPISSNQSIDQHLRDAGGKRLAAGICGIILGCLGVHKFLLGYSTPGVIMLLVTLLTLGVGALPMSVIGIVEGVIYLSKSDNDFYSTYIENKREWF